MDHPKEVKVEIEYCTACNYKQECLDLKEIVKQMCPAADVICRGGRRGSFEVLINDRLIHSKLASMAFPNFVAVGHNAKRVSEGESIEQVPQQPITDCTIQ